MTIEVRVPVLPESVEDATVATWHKKAGDAVSRDDNLLDLETDKVVLEVPAPADGVIKEITVEAGATVLSGQLLAVIEKAETQTAAGARSEPAPDSVAPPAGEADVGSGTKPKPADSPMSPAKLSPAVRRVVAEENIDPASVPGSGRGGRITKGDVLSFMKGGAARHEERVRMTRLRSRIAERMKEAQNTAAMLTSFNEVDLKAIMDLRRRYRDEFVERHGTKLGLMSFFVKACCDALRKHPVVNASIDGDEIVYHNYQDIGIAVSTDRGLMVPIIRNAELMSMAQIEQAIEEFARSARDGSIRLVDLQGGTFTITLPRAPSWECTPSRNDR
jgi:2-oxoglutarate dehydrogenase E2 component (dihydrolipoamide succinyltransferase)